MKNKLYFNGAYNLDKRNRLVYTIVTCKREETALNL